MQHLIDEGIAFSRLRGFHLHMIMGDLLHILLLGFLFNLNGAALWELAWDQEFFGQRTRRGPWRPQANAVLGIAFRAFKKYCKDNHLECSHPSFTVGGLKMESLQSNPILEGKGANTFAISLWLAHCTAELALRMPTEHNRLLATALLGFTRTVTICKAHFWLDDAAVAELHITRPVALCAFKALCAESLARNRNYYP